MKDTRFERSGTVCPNVGICKKTRSQSRDTFIVLLVQCIGDLGYRAGVITGGYGSGRVSEISSSSDRNPCVSPDGHYVRTTTILWWLNNEDKSAGRTEIRYISSRSRSATTISRICEMLIISMAHLNGSTLISSSMVYIFTLIYVHESPDIKLFIFLNWALTPSHGSADFKLVSIFAFLQPPLCVRDSCIFAQERNSIVAEK